MRKRNNVTKGWKSTLTGLVIIAVSLAYMIIAETLNFYAFGTAIIIGVLLLFSPDTLINTIENFFKNKNSNNLNNE
jgi:hypothetical protein